MRGQTACFTGHRDIPPQELARVTTRTEQAIRELIGKGVIYFGVGGALGFDYEKGKVM